MPVYEISVEKYHAAASEYWVNVYHVNATAGSDALPAITSIVNAEKALYHTDTTITKATLRAAAPGNLGEAVVFNVAGTRAINADLVPLFVVARVDFTVPGSRPSRKYLRSVFDEVNITFTSIQSPMLTALNSYASAIVAVPGICDVDGQAITAGSAKPVVAMRQLRRGSKKRATP